MTKNRRIKNVHMTIFKEVAQGTVKMNIKHTKMYRKNQNNKTK